MPKTKREMSAEVAVYSPRWGHDDIHHLVMNEMKLHFSGNGPGANCSRDDDGNKTWSGYGEDIGDNPLISVLENDAIYPPSILVEAIEWLWEDWLKYEITDDEARAELKVLFDWVNVCSHNKPKLGFWSQKF
jgi:hypothetical protein